MSRDVRQYWRDVRALEAGLPEFVWLVGVGDIVAAVTEAPAAVAARLLRAKSHRRATDDEVAAHQAREREANRAAREERMRKDGASLVVVR
jgi:ribosomal protein L12E/L44/L45/RPP1/RPP2